MSGQVQVQPQTRKEFLPRFSDCCAPLASRCRTDHERMHRHFAQLRADFEGALAVEEQIVKRRIARDIKYIDDRIHDVETQFEHVVAKISSELQLEKERIKSALNYAGKELKLDLIALLKNVNIIETRLQRLCEVLIEILIQLHAANIPPITEVQEGILGALVALAALDLLMTGDKKLNDYIRERLGDKTVNPKLDPLGRAIKIVRDDMVPGFSHMLLMGEAMGLVPMGSATAVELALQSVCDKALEMDQFADEEVAKAEAAVAGAFNDVTHTLMLPVHYVGSWVTWATSNNNAQAAAAPAAAPAAAGAPAGVPQPPRALARV